MNRHRDVISEEIRDDILARSLQASSKNDIPRAIFGAIVDGGLDWRAVSPDDVKPVLVEALRATNQQRPQPKPIATIVTSPDTVAASVC